ncbi:MAG: hypothetical protein U0989_01565 [Azonexus sp.]|nr:hypothetical protein [Azonexus sp.]MDP3637555.1 hypothetical protein [Azonexus sp.]MDZ4313453.1 hypothetical protein [Azonexus sp.]
MDKMGIPVFRTIHGDDIALMACAELCREIKFPLQKPDVLYAGAHMPQVHSWRDRAGFSAESHLCAIEQRWWAARCSFGVV